MPSQKSKSSSRSHFPKRTTQAASPSEKKIASAKRSLQRGNPGKALQILQTIDPRDPLHPEALLLSNFANSLQTGEKMNEYWPDLDHTRILSNKRWLSFEKTELADSIELKSGLDTEKDRRDTFFFIGKKEIYHPKGRINQAFHAVRDAICALENDR